MKAGFTIRTITVENGGFTYRTHRLAGWLNGRRIREQFKSREEAEGRKNELEVEAANGSGLSRARVTRLSEAQLAEAETAFTRLGEKSLTDAVAWYLKNYRPPSSAKPIADAVADFLAHQEQHVRPVVMRGFRHTTKALKIAFPSQHVHEITTADIQAFLAARNIGKKRFNNLRGELHTFFAFCTIAPRKWTMENPVTPIPAFKLSRGLPEIITTQTAARLMEYVEAYTGGERSELPAGCLVPYFALALFAGLRPSIKDGEIAKLAQLPDPSKAIDLGLGVVRLTPDVSKVKSLRSVTIHPNLSAWLMKYSVKKFPIIPPNAVRMIGAIKSKFGIGQDVMRHTFISMHVAKFRSMSEAALEAGNSETMIRKHYYNTVSAADAVAFWNIAPGVTVGEVVKIAG